MFRVLKFFVVLSIYEVVATLFVYLFLNMGQAISFLVLLNIAIGIFSLWPQKFLAGHLKAKRMSKSGNTKLFQRLGNISHLYNAKEVDIYSYESSEKNSIYVSSLIGRSYFFLSTDLLGRVSTKDLEVHFAFMSAKQEKFWEGISESFIAIWGLFNLYIIELVCYPFIKLLGAKYIEYMRKSLILLFVPIFSFVKRIVLGRSVSENLIKELESKGVPSSQLISAVLKTNGTLKNELFELDLLEHNKFLSNEFCVHKSQLN